MLHGQDLTSYIIWMKVLLKTILKFESKNDLGVKYLICQQNLGWDI